MRINGMSAALGGVGPADSSGLVDRIMQVEQGPLNQVKGRREKLVGERNDYKSLHGMLGDLDGALSGLKTRAGFSKLMVESSHPDIIEGIVDGIATPGSFEMEVKGLANADKHLAIGFPDADKSEVGFGWLQVEGAQGLHNVTIDPGSTLKDVAAKINDSAAGVRAQIINTGSKDDPFRLMVTSLETGAEAKINIDPDTSFLDFKNIKPGKNLDVKFEDVDITRAGNKMDDLVEGVKLKAKRAEPGTKVRVDISHDVPKTLDGIKAFTDKYNQLAKFANDSFKLDPSTNKPAGKLPSDGNMRTILRSMQTTMSAPGAAGKFGSLAAIGITTDAHSGELHIDEKKLKGALESDYDSVSKIFSTSDDGPGLAGRLSDALKRFTSPADGVLKNREQSLDNLVKEQDKQIEKQTRRLDERREGLERQFSAMNSHLNGLQAQQSVLNARLGGGEAPQEQSHAQPG